MGSLTTSWKTFYSIIIPSWPCESQSPSNDDNADDATVMMCVELKTGFRSSLFVSSPLSHYAASRNDSYFIYSSDEYAFDRIKVDRYYGEIVILTN